VTEPTNQALGADPADDEIRGLLQGVARRAQQSAERRERLLNGAGALVELVLDRLVQQSRAAAFAETDRDELEEQLDERNAELAGTRDACEQLRQECERYARQLDEVHAARGPLVDELVELRSRVSDLEAGRRRLREALVSIRNAEIAPGSSAEGLLAAIAIVARDVLELDGGLDLAREAPSAKRDILELGAQLGQAG
jgi:chromosome segregation ATPase